MRFSLALAVSLTGCSSPSGATGSAASTPAATAVSAPSIAASTGAPSATVVASESSRPSERVADDDSIESMAGKLAGIRAGEEREVGDGVFVKMFRMQASNPIGGGWHEARSTGGGFSVELPLAFNDFVLRSNTKEHAELRSYSIGAKSTGLLSWAATCIARSDGKLDRTKAGPTGEIQTLGTPVKAYSMGTLFDDMACVLVVEAQGTDPLPPEADRNRFLHSLKRIGKPTF